MYYFIKETRFRKSILQIRIKNFISIRHQIRTTLLFSIFNALKAFNKVRPTKPTSATSVWSQVAVRNSTPNNNE